jgi:hypothetical protein
MIARSLIFLVAACATPFISYGQDEKKDQPYAVYVYDYQGESENKKDLEKATENVRKKVKDRKKWFRLVEDPLEAEIQVEVLNQGKAEDLKAAQAGRAGSTAGTEGTDMALMGLLDTERSYFMECQYTIPGKFRGKFMVTGRSTKLAAEEVARRLRTFCATSCRQ